MTKKNDPFDLPTPAQVDAARENDLRPIMAKLHARCLAALNKGETKVYIDACYKSGLDRQALDEYMRTINAKNQWSVMFHTSDDMRYCHDSREPACWLTFTRKTYER